MEYIVSSGSVNRKKSFNEMMEITKLFSEKIDKIWNLDLTDEEKDKKLSNLIILETANEFEITEEEVISIIKELSEKLKEDKEESETKTFEELVLEDLKYSKMSEVKESLVRNTNFLLFHIHLEKEKLRENKFNEMLSQFSKEMTKLSYTELENDQIIYDKQNYHYNKKNNDFKKLTQKPIFEKKYTRQKRI